MCKLNIKREMWTKPTYAKSIHREEITAARGVIEVAQRVCKTKRKRA